MIIIHLTIISFDNDKAEIIINEHVNIHVYKIRE